MRPLRVLGFTLVELLIALALGAIVIAGLAGIVDRATATRDFVGSDNRVQRDARFAMQRMVTAVAHSSRLVLPLPDSPLTGWREHVREQTIPASPPETGSTAASAVLAVTISLQTDLNADGVPDADNDRDGLIDEDPGRDMNSDWAAGIAGVDDDGDGSIDESSAEDDDEDGDTASLKDEDPQNSVDDDGDGLVDEDPGDDLNGDNAAGIATVDDDGDGKVDESNANDDDEDEDNFGGRDEDGWDTQVFYLIGSTLTERHPVPWDQDLNSVVDGRDVIESTLAENVTLFRVERVPPGPSGVQLVDITLELSGPHGTQVSLQTRVRLGAAL